MSGDIEFVRNYSDLSSDKGFQFEFHCDRCGGGHRTTFKASATGTISTALDAASSVLGGLFSSAANLSGRVHSAAWERDHDKHFIEAQQEALPFFIQCPHCLAWICRQKCWSEERGLCKQCAPDMEVERSAAQASLTREEVWAHARVAEEDRPMLTEASNREKLRATCPKCEAPLKPGAKFCGECGAKLDVQAHCTECGAELAEGAKFCGECGHKSAE